MGPIWVVPIIVSIFIILWKFPIIRRSSNKIGHLLDLGSYVGAAFVLYGLLFWLGVEIARHITGVINVPIIHVGTIVAFVMFYVVVLFKTERGIKKAGPIEIETLVKGMNRMYDLLKKTEKSYGDLSEMLGEVVERIDKAMRGIDGAVERQNEVIEVLKETVTGRMNEFEDTVAYAAKMRREESDKMKRIAEKQRKNIEALREEVRAFRGVKAERKGHEWEDVIADRIKNLGFEVEVGRVKGQPDIIIKGSGGNVVGVVGCKSYSLKSTRGMSEKFKPEVEFAREEGVPLAVAIRNRLNNLEFFKIYKLDELEDFTCSTPTWLVGKGVEKEDRGEEAKSKREFREFLTEIS